MSNGKQYQILLTVSEKKILPLLALAMGMSSMVVFAGSEEGIYDVERTAQSLEVRGENADVIAVREFARREGVVLTSEQIRSVLENTPGLVDAVQDGSRESTEQAAVLATETAKFEVLGRKFVSGTGGLFPTNRYAGGNFTDGTNVEVFLNYSTTGLFASDQGLYARVADGGVVASLASVSAGATGVYGAANIATASLNVGVQGSTNQPNGYGGYFTNYHNVSGTGDYAQALYVKADGRISTHSSDPRSYVATIEVTNPGAASGLAIYMNNQQAGSADDYIGFITRNAADDGGHFAGGIRGVVGATENGIQLVSNAADFAEFLPRANPDEKLEPGDIVGVTQGRVSRDLTGAHHVQVVSTAPVVAGNMPQRDDEHLYEQVAFIGQAPVKVKGSVKAGDYIVASGKNDGLGIAVSPDNMTPEDFKMAVGQAWESSDEQGVKLINTAVGLAADDAYAYMKKQDQRIASQDQRIVSLEQQLSAKMARLDRLAAQMESLTQKVAYIQSANMTASASAK